MSPRILHIGALVIGLYLLFGTTGADGNSPALDFGNALQPSTGTSFADVGLVGYAGLGLAAWGTYSLFA